MAKLSKQEKDELLKLAKSRKLSAGSSLINKNRINPFLKSDGTVDVDKYIFFLTEYNRFINHNPRPFRRIVDKDMRL